MFEEKDNLFRVNTRNTVKSPDKGLLLGLHTRPVGLYPGFENTEKHDGFGCV